MSQTYSSLAENVAGPALQHINIKIFAAPGAEVQPGDLIAVFHRWIQRGTLPGLLIDVADYSHVPSGPGVVLVAHEAIYSFDYTRNRPGLLYNRRVATDATPADALRQAYRAALTASEQLQSEPEFQGKLAFDPNEIELTFNDRLMHPNTDASWERIREDVTAFFDEIFGVEAYTLTRAPDPRERLRLNARRAISI
jgi:hypothetical protein